MNTFFEVLSNQGMRRQGRLRTRHGSVDTPFFLPDATRAAVRGIEPSMVALSGIEALVVNTYHLLLSPGSELIARMGGIHAFMQWNGPLLSDSGGYQVYSLIHQHPDRGEVSEEGAIFRSPLDGSKQLLTPERSIDIQFDLGVDMMVCLDDPRPNDAPSEDLVLAVERTIRWALRCRTRFDERVREFPEGERPLLFSVVQGGMDIELRRRCAAELVGIGFDGYGFGARHLDRDGEFLTDVLRETAAALPENSIRFALGIGTPADIIRAYQFGWDIFDCVIPTREGRHGRAFLRTQSSTNIFTEPFSEAVNLTARRFQEDASPIDISCDCFACSSGFSRGYIRHLFAVRESLGARLVSLHNLRFYTRLMEELRKETEK